MSFDWYTIWESICAFFASEEAPAWVQAGGSVAALFIAIWISRSSIRHAAKAKRKNIYAIAEATHTYACIIRKAIDETEWVTGNNSQIYAVYNKVVIEGIVKALQEVPVHEIGSSKGVLAMLSLINQMEFLGLAVETLLQGPYKHPVLGKSLESLDDTDYRVQRHEVIATGFSVLQQNARGHLNKIDEDYETLKESLGG